MKWNIWEAEQQTAREADALNLLHVIRPNILSDYYNMYIKVSIDPCNQSKTLTRKGTIKKVATNAILRYYISF